MVRMKRGVHFVNLFYGTLALLRLLTKSGKANQIGFDGIHWRNLDEDISFESFSYEDAEPTALQKFFLTHKELNIAEFAKLIGINASLLRNYINGFKKPSKEREEEILRCIHKIGSEYSTVYFLKL